VDSPVTLIQSKPLGRSEWMAGLLVLRLAVFFCNNRQPASRLTLRSNKLDTEILGQDGVLVWSPQTHCATPGSSISDIYG